MMQDVAVAVEQTATAGLTQPDSRLRYGQTVDTGSWALEVRTPLPAVCARHGRPAVGRYKQTTQFHQGRRGQVEKTFASEMASGLSRVLWLGQARLPQTSTLVRGVWPVCARCVQQRKVLCRIAKAIGWAVIPIVLLLVAVKVGAAPWVPLPVPVLLLFPGWIPCGLIAAFSVAGRATRYVYFRPIRSPETVVLVAHPRFAEAIAARGGSSDQ